MCSGPAVEPESGDQCQQPPPLIKSMYILIIVLPVPILSHLLITEPDGALSSSQHAKATMFYNLATVFCVLKEHDKAKQSLQKVRSTSN